jgi:hypothetical protein
MAYRESVKRMRTFYTDEGPIDTLLQIAAKPVWDGDLISKASRSEFVQLGWVAQSHGWNIITPDGEAVVKALRLAREPGLRGEMPPRPSSPPTHFPVG